MISINEELYSKSTRVTFWPIRNSPKMGQFKYFNHENFDHRETSTSVDNTRLGGFFLANILSGG